MYYNFKFIIYYIDYNANYNAENVKMYQVLTAKIFEVLTYL